MAYQQLQKDVNQINEHMESLNKEIQTMVDGGMTEKAKEIRQQVAEIRRTLREVRNGERAKVNGVPVRQAVKEPDKITDDPQDYNLTKMWGDPRHNPYWLKLAEYFGVKEKEYPIASSKINTILDWAANKAKSRKTGDILSVIGSQMRKIQSPGMSERAYAVLYRYIRLEEEKANASPEIKKEIEREMSAYRNAT